jgi:predicted phage replisome organizer
VANDKKFYWLKLKKDFFKRHDIQIIESMPNGKDYILFYLKMLVESVDHDGNLRFNDTIPYNETMLATITQTNIDIVRNAMKVFTELRMIEVLEDETIYMAEVSKMMGTETYWAEKKRQQRIGQCPSNVPLLSKMSKVEIDIDKDIEIDIKDNGTSPQKHTFKPPTLEEVQAYCKERNNKVDAEKWLNHYTSNGWMVGKVKMKDWKAAVRTWEKSEISQKPQQQKPTFNNFTGREYDAKALEESWHQKTSKVDIDQRDGESIEEWQQRMLATRSEVKP